MAFETLTKQRPFIKPKNMKKDEVIEGYVLGPWTSDKYPEHINLILSLSKDHTFVTDKKNADGTITNETITVKAGNEVILQGGGNLKYFFVNDFPVGNLYRFTYNGMIINRKGRAAGKSSHNFQIQVDRDNKYAGELPQSVAKSEAAEASGINF